MDIAHATKAVARLGGGTRACRVYARPGAAAGVLATAQRQAALRRGVLAPPSLEQAGFVHLSTPDQVALPAGRLFRGRRDVVVLLLDPARIGVEIRFEPGVPIDPASMRFSHAYGPVPTRAVLAVLPPYRPRPGGGFDEPAVPSTDPAGRLALFEPSLLRRAATTEIPVTGGVAVLTAAIPASYQHNQLLIDGEVDATQPGADADRVPAAPGSRPAKPCSRAPRVRRGHGIVDGRAPPRATRRSAGGRGGGTPVDG